MQKLNRPYNFLIVLQMSLTQNTCTKQVSKHEKGQTQPESHRKKENKPHLYFLHDQPTREYIVQTIKVE